VPLAAFDADAATRRLQEAVRAHDRLLLEELVSIALLLAISLLANLPAVASRLPTRLAQGVSALIQHNKANDIWRPYSSPAPHLVL
jgi:hypothetical protein